MILPPSDQPQSIAKRLYYYGNNYRDGWWRWRWLLWLLILIPIFGLLFLFLWRRRKRNRAVTYATTTQQPLPPQQQQPPYYSSTYIPPSMPQTGQYGGYGYQTEQTGGTYDYSRPEGPPAAHTKS